jgi:hypothetical protein
MQKPSEVKAKATGPNGNGPAYPKSLIRRYTNFGRLFEILAVASLTGCFFTFWLGSQSRAAAAGLLVLLISAFLVTYKVAIFCAVRARLLKRARTSNQNKVAAESSYQVTSARLRTLGAVGVPPDVTTALLNLNQQPPLPADEFLAKLAVDPMTDLGWERTNEFKEKILRYTKLDRPADLSSAGKGDLFLKSA